MKQINSVVTYQDYGSVSINIKDIMKNRGISQTQLIRNTGLSYDVIIKYINGSIVRYDSSVLAKICYVLNCKISDIIFYEEPKNK